MRTGRFDVETIAWLLSGDPAVRWQAMRDLTNDPRATVAFERARVSLSGIGAAILDRQESDGAWRRAGTPTWATTLFTLQLLRATGIDVAQTAVASAFARLENNLGWDATVGLWDLRSRDVARPFVDGEEEPCINGGVLALGAYFGRPSNGLARRLLAEQLDDGGWNCEAPKSRRSSFDTTLCVLEGLLEYERAAGTSPEIAAARRRGEDYLLERELVRRRGTREIVKPDYLEFAFPTRYHYDVLRALDYFRSCGGRPDARLGAAVALVGNRRSDDGRWLLDRAYDETLSVTTGEVVGEPSRWTTLRALRVVAWWDAAEREARCPEQPTG